MREGAKIISGLVPEILQGKTEISGCEARSPVHINTSGFFKRIRDVLRY